MTIARIVIATFVAALAPALVAGSAFGFAYEKYMGHPIKRKGASIGFYAGALSYPEGSPQRGAFLLAQGRWNETPGNFTFGTPLWGAAKVKRYNGDSETWYTSDQGILKGRGAVCTSVNAYTIPAKIVEADIFFDAAEPWYYTEARADSWAYGGTKSPFVNAALHELGHAFGLKHVNSIYNIMGTDGTHVTANGGIFRAYVGEDAIEGQVFLYGENAGAGADLSVSHWKYGWADGEYSAHIDTEIFPPGGNVRVAINGTRLQGRQVYRVKRGQPYDTEFTYENNGVADEDGVDVGFYISTDATITTADRKVRSFKIGKIGRGLPGTWRNRVDIPADLIAGQVYYLGVIIDSDDSTGELVEQNNAAFLPIHVL